MAQRLADLGYAVLLPDPYYRLGEIAPFDMKNVFSDEAERNRLMKLVGSVTKEQRHDRHRRPSSTGSPSSPRCRRPRSARPATAWAAGMALNAAGRFPDRVGAAASFHGGQIASTAPDSPHLLAGEMQAKVYVAGAEKDGSFDDEQFERLQKALTEAGRRPHAGDVPGRCTASPSPTTRPTTRPRRPATGRRSRSSTGRR